MTRLSDLISWCKDKCERTTSAIVTTSCIVTDPMQLSRESFYEDYIILCIASFRITSHFEERGKGANSAFEYLDGQLGTYSLRED